MRTVLVTGGCGFIGSHIVDALIARGNRVVVIDDLSTGKIQNLNNEAVFYQGDIAEELLLEKVFGQHRFDIVIHQAAKINTNVLHEHPLTDIRTSVIGTLRLIECCLKHEVSKFVYASSVAIYGHPKQVPVNEHIALKPVYSYGIAKLCAERYLDFYAHNYNLSYHALRYANVYGPRQPIYGEVGVIAIFTERLIGGQVLPVYGDGENCRDYIYVEDVVETTIRSLDIDDNLVVNVGCGVGVSVNRLLEVFEKIWPQPLRVEHKPERIGELGSFYCQIDQLRNALNWHPKTDLVQGITKTIQYYAPHIV